jgi:sugar-specific transcriptional regulator TrmB
MSKKVASSEYLRARGLSEAETKVYSTVLGLGNATIGEINLILNMELPEIYNQIKQLQEIGYIKQIPGKVPRYIAMEPFLKDYSKHSSEVKLGLVNILNQFHTQVEESSTKLQTIIPRLETVCNQEKEMRVKKVEENLNKLQLSLNKMIDNSYLQFEQLEQSLGSWPSKSIEKTIAAFENNLLQSKDTFTTAISKYTDSLVIDSREIRNKLEKATIHHKVFIAEKLEGLDKTIKEKLTEVKDKIVKENYETVSEYSIKLDDRDIQSREDAAQIIHELIKNTVVLARQKEGDISSDTSQMVNNALVPLFQKFDVLQKSLKKDLEEVLEKNSQQITNTINQIEDKIKKTIPESLTVLTNHLEDSRDESAEFVDKKITEPFDKLENIKVAINEDIKIFKENILAEAYEQEKIAKQSLRDKIERTKDKVELSKEEIKDTVSLSKITLEDILEKLIKDVLN